MLIDTDCLCAVIYMHIDKDCLYVAVSHLCLGMDCCFYTGSYMHKAEGFVVIHVCTGTVCLHIVTHIYTGSNCL